MSAPYLRETAHMMREVASSAMHHDAKRPGVWMTEHHGSQYQSRPDVCHIAEDRSSVYWSVAHEVYIPNAEHMAAWDPHVALIVADWLDATADRMGGKSWTGSRHALAVARAWRGDAA